VDVLPTVGLEERCFDCTRLGLVDRAAASCSEVIPVGFGLSLQDTVHRGDQLNEFADRDIALNRLIGAAVFLSGEASSFVNGHTLYVDGGITTCL
jgi:gluconate 5-dehydrogenase